VSVLVVGEALVDVVQRRSGAIDRHPGGSPTNVAVGLARLGHDVVLSTRIGADDDGALLRRHLEADHVRLAPGSLVPGRTSTATALLDEQGAATYVFDLDWHLPDVDLAGVQHVHVGSIGAVLPPGGESVRELVRRARTAGVTTSYDPNLRPALIGPAEQQRPVIEGLVRSSTVVKASDEDVAWLYAGTSTPDPTTAAARWATTGPRLVVLTRGSAGAVAWRGDRPDEPVVLAAPVVDVVDTVGAGDAFMAGLLSGLLDAGLLGGPVDEDAPEWAADDVRPALQRALQVAALTCARHGADPPHRDDL
jgi:fructokinase